jgi:hypothetical protein
MSAYLFQAELPAATEEIVNTIPRHRQHVNRLFAEGRILSYSVSAQRTMIWCVINAEDEQEALEIFSRFPLYPYFQEVSCNALLFHNTLPATLPEISLN